MSVILQVKGLKTYFHTYDGLVKAVDGVSYHVREGEIVGLVGESGCGKSVSQLSVLQLVPMPPGEIVEGEVIFEGRDLLKFDPKGPEMRSVRGGKIAMVFHEPMSSLNPVLTIERQLTEGLEIHLGMERGSAKKRAAEVLEMVGLPEPEKRLRDYPHQFSGGMRQRVMIAMAISCNPRLIIADEPTTALDVTTQAQLLELLRDTVSRSNASLIIVTHDLGVVARYAHRIYVMYAGHIVETGTAKEIFEDPRHPYTKGLLACVPRLDEKSSQRLVPIPGMPPNLIDLPQSCPFVPRCSFRNQKCWKDPRPELKHLEGEHFVACHVEA